MQQLANEIDTVDSERINNEHNGRPGKAFSLKRTYPASRYYLWSVLPEASHLSEWFLPSYWGA